LRVIAGAARGRSLQVPRGTSTRPTSDLAKGAIFAMLEAEAYKRGYEPDEEGTMAAGLAWPHVLDVFAGSGALGIEALSRGARHAEFVEQDPAACRTIRANLAKTGFLDRATIHQLPARQALARASKPVDLVLLDPPYGERSALDAALAVLETEQLLTRSGAVVLEQSSSDAPPDAIAAIPLARTRIHGSTRLTLYAHALRNDV
jgi:16S rRNA (guanine966-N2)-methyltransferase